VIVKAQTPVTSHNSRKISRVHNDGKLQFYLFSKFALQQDHPSKICTQNK